MEMKKKHEKESFDSALKVQEGIPQPPVLNETAVTRFKRTRKQLPSVEAFMEGILNFNRTLFSQAITLVESALPEHQALAQEIIARCLPHAGKSVRLGVTGVPGAGKSTFIEALGTYLTGNGHKLAVLAIDPSSSRSKGSILGDKTRMEGLSTHPNAFIRPSPSAGSLGGVARKTRETIIICEAAGFDTIIVETVGVGQSEIAVHSMVDFFLLLMISGAGDELQGIKRGIMEMADAIAVNKADGDNKTRAQIACTQIKNALHLFPLPESGWSPPAITCSSLTGDGIPGVWDTITEYNRFTQANGYFRLKRQQQSKQIMIDSIDHRLHDHFYLNPEIKTALRQVEHKMLADQMTPYQAAAQLLELYFRSMGK
ncbi:methylmalonyl Co-A mutase-associated GTPase MeaB [Lentimicrobium sp.]|uniref:methylmalonyl Co-A mutase-associated GTPase MeaB n=2 Tax=Lentimicrobium sp. TaxID=2034841 RepID=UPI002C16B0A0|nr:methylmalonyl Co-A mutase-associated GTPase MeaB [Lentimicrobium sp.]HPR26911.1 methylmalonyl Co-A mutase-associated GTPase MeaB [Lentimicrobium sp.]